MQIGITFPEVPEVFIQHLSCHLSDLRRGSCIVFIADLND